MRLSRALFMSCRRATLSMPEVLASRRMTPCTLILITPEYSARPLSGWLQPINSRKVIPLERTIRDCPRVH